MDPSARLRERPLIRWVVRLIVTIGTDVGDARFKSLVPTGRASRAARLGAATGLTAPFLFFFAFLAAQLSTPLAAKVFLLVISSVGGALLAWMWGRLPFTGVDLSEDRARVRSWFSSRLFMRAHIERFSYADYGGLFYIVGWPVAGGSLQSGMITVVTTAPSGEQELNGTVTNHRVAREQAEMLNQWLGLSVGASHGRRRARSAARQRSPK